MRRIAFYLYDYQGLGHVRRSTAIAHALARADAALTALLDGCGERPAHLSWYLSAALLRPAPSPLRLHKRRRPQRVAAIVAAAGEVLGR